MRCKNCGIRMIQTDCCTFVCPKCSQFSIDRKKGLKEIAKLDAEIKALEMTPNAEDVKDGALLEILKFCRIIKEKIEEMNKQPCPRNRSEYDVKECAGCKEEFNCFRRELRWK